MRKGLRQERPEAPSPAAPPVAVHLLLPREHPKYVRLPRLALGNPSPEEPQILGDGT